MGEIRLLNFEENCPNVFISYAWENEEHNEWVKRLADLLLDNGVNAILDEYDIAPGGRIPHFMEEAVTKADKVLIICTEKYKKKADTRTGGVGYEEHIISEELMQGRESKFIPIIKQGKSNTAIPNCLKGKKYYDLTLSKEPKYEEIQDFLLYGIFEQKKKPVIGKRPDVVKQYKRIDNPEDIRILEIIVDEVTAPRNDGTRGCALYKVPFRLSKRPTNLWTEIFINAWNNPPVFTTMHRPGIASVYADKIILDGTTLDEVQKYHKETLIMCVEIANKEEKKILQREEVERLKAQQAEEERRKQVEAFASQITF